MKNSAGQIVTKDDYDNSINYLEKLLSKGDDNLTNEDVDIIKTTSAIAAKYEFDNNYVPIPRNNLLALETDKTKIAQVLGFEPDLIELIEFKMYQLKLNQNALAEKLNMQASKISQILNRKRQPDVSFLKAIHQKLGIDGNYLLEMV